MVEGKQTFICAFSHNGRRIKMEVVVGRIMPLPKMSMS